MTPDLLLTFSVYAFVTSITPGPNNTMLLASGLNHGFARTIPHLCGVSLGLALMLIAIGAGLGRLFVVFPSLHSILRWIGAAYLLWLAWKIARSSPLSDETRRAAPVSFLQAAAFQWANPKCWVMVMGALTTYMPEGNRANRLAVITLVYTVVNAPCVCAWAGCGVALRRWLNDPRLTRTVNFVMAALLVLSLYPLFIGAPA